MLWIAAVGFATAEAPVSLRLLDDRGLEIEGPLEVCFQVDVRTECSTVNPGGTVTLPIRFLSVRAEGPDHGPVTVLLEGLEADAAGKAVVRVPRKALLRVEGLPAEPLTVSLYDPRAASLVKPFSSARFGAQGVKVPVGELVVSLTAGKRAPDLHRLSTVPGGEARLTYQPRDGWSLMVRCQAPKARRGLAGTVVTAASVPGYGRPEISAGKETTGADGLVFFAGLPAGTASVQARHPDFVAHKAPGLTAAPGALALHEAVLTEGGSLRATVTVDGQPRQGIPCTVFDLQRPPSAEREALPPEKLGTAKTDRSGVCRISRLPAGSYLLAVDLGEEKKPMRRAIVVTDGAETEEDMALSRLRVSGKVSRGEKPVPGLTVLFVRIKDEPLTMSSAEAPTLEDGSYEVTLWEPGDYRAMVAPSLGRPAVTYREVVVVDRETSVDFVLAGGSVHGRIVDEEGHPLTRATVTLRWNVSDQKYGLSDEQGEFEFFVDEGRGEVTAEKQGFRASAVHEVEVAGEAETPAVVVVLPREKLLRGKLTSAAGVPVTGAWVGSVRAYYGDEQLPAQESRSDAEGRFEVAPVPGGPNRLFASGPDCPLSFHDPGSATENLSFRCPGPPAALELTLRDAEGRPLAGAEVLLRQGGVLIHPEVLESHLGIQGLSARTDGSGRLMVPNLAAGDYEVFLYNRRDAVGMIEAGSRTGYLTSTRLIPLVTTPAEVTAGGRP